MGISLIGRHVATEQSGPPRNQVRFSNSSYLMEMLELRMSMLFEDASDDNDENASYIEENDEVDEREYDLPHIIIANIEDKDEVDEREYDPASIL